MGLIVYSGFMLRNSIAKRRCIPAAGIGVDVIENVRRGN
jgi:hypothetical protein